MIVVGSRNPAKVTPVRDVFAQVRPGVPVEGLDVPSLVPDQPVGWQETLLGARNRAVGALDTPGATWGVGLEGGVEFEAQGRGWLMGFVAVAHAGRVSWARTVSVPLPPPVTARVRVGEELGKVMDDLHGTQGNNTRGGAFGLLTGGLVVRADVWRQTLTLALAPHLNPELYGEPLPDERFTGGVQRT